MSLAGGTRLGPYEILSPLGAGGMGEVYKAKDSRLNRIVAVKVVAVDQAFNQAELRQRFEREAQVIAALNHPHICTVYDVGKEGEVAFLVMEYLLGETLAARLKSGALPLDEALRHAIDIADALDKAHRHGVVHRDLKPGNVMLTSTGAKLLDFGLAKLRTQGGDSEGEGMSQLPTRNDDLTGDRILGTVPYMAPEQLENRNADARTDIFALGATIYEMVTGRQAFTGSSQASLIAAILMTDAPPMSGLQPLIPFALERVVRKCLAKDPDRRWQDAGDLSDELKWIADSLSGGGEDASPAVAPRRRAISWGVAAAIAVLAVIATSLAAWALTLASPPRGASVVRVAIPLPPGQQLGDLQYPAVALSADGSRLAYVASQSSSRRIYIRSMESTEAKGLAGTEDATAPFFSPDGQWVGFFAGGKLKKVSIAGGALQTLWDCPLGEGGSWGPDDTIYFAPTSLSGLWKIPASGGTARQITTLDRSKGEVSHRWPQVLPGGKALLFTVWTGPGLDEKQAHVQSLETGERHVLQVGADTGRYVSTGHLIYSRADALMAVPLDLAQLKVTSSATMVLAETVWTGAQGAQYAVSDSGTLAYVAGDVRRYERRLVWVDRSGNVEALPAPLKAYGSPQISPDGRSAAVEVGEGAVGIWIYDFSRATLAPLTSGGSSQQPTWTPDSRRIAYRATRAGFRNLFWIAADRTGEEERLATSDNIQTPNSWSPDGKVLAFHEIALGTGRDILALHRGDGKVDVILKTRAGEGGARFSPDGRWLAYVSDESGRYQVYIQPFPGPGAKRQISTEGGTEPVWSRDGRELFYLSGDKMMAVTVTTQSVLSTGSPRLLFEGRYDTSVTNTSSYDVSLDGRRFLRAQPTDTGRGADQIQVVINWFDSVRQRVRLRE